MSNHTYKPGDWVVPVEGGAPIRLGPPGGGATFRAAINGTILTGDSWFPASWLRPARVADLVGWVTPEELAQYQLGEQGGSL